MVVPTINTTPVIANKQMKAFCFSPLVAAKYMTMNTSKRTDAMDCDVVNPNILITKIMLTLALRFIINYKFFTFISNRFILLKITFVNFLTDHEFLFLRFAIFLIIRHNQKKQKNQQKIGIVRMKVLRLSQFMFCSSKTPIAKQPKLIKIIVDNEGQQLTFAFPMHSKLAKNLEKVGVPLQFQCGYGCSCGTCAVILNSQDYKKVTEKQPLSPNQKKVLMQSTEFENIRLTCQLFVDEYMDGMILKIQ